MRTGRKHLLALLVAALAFVVALAGCAGGAGGATGSAAAAFPGTWAISSYVTDGKALTDEELKVVQAMGIYLTLEEDGKATFEMFGSSMEGTWEQSGANTATLTIDDGTGEDSTSTEELTITGETLSMSDGTEEMVFSRIDPSEKQSPDMGSLATGGGEQTGATEESSDAA